MKDLEKFTTLLTLNIGQMLLVSMFLPLGILHGCPKGKNAGKIAAAKSH